MTPEQKQEAVRRHNETATYCPNQMRQVARWEDLLPHQQKEYEEQARALLDS